MSAKKKVDVQSGDTEPENDHGPDEPAEHQQPDTGPGFENRDGGGRDESNSIEEMQRQLISAKNEAEENYDRLLRVSAELENFKKRSAREMEEFKKFSNQSLIKELLPIIDNLELAIKSYSTSEARSNESLLEGVSLIHKEMLKLLEKFQVKQVESMGQPFDPNYHEAVMREEADNVSENTVVDELQKGYVMHNRLIRPSMVVVAAPKIPSSTDGDG